MKRDFVKTKEELCIEYREGWRNKGGGGVVAGFCKDHIELWKKGSSRLWLGMSTRNSKIL
ncbi:unnamed protein product [Camellia sinensis]